jgi:hypothetical protein
MSLAGPHGKSALGGPRRKPRGAYFAVSVGSPGR